ncbi:unnamed protein product [Nesidiocoris tenuis]|uniref:Uncharacterized protein n=1 Tax=Nesidiocoris tenuis TaxID=355587 RepID=A0A6H5HCS5_9HEMI|nr:unnamed protein product [Nesidiocoris tenuis]
MKYILYPSNAFRALDESRSIRSQHYDLYIGNVFLRPDKPKFTYVASNSKCFETISAIAKFDYEDVALGFHSSVSIVGEVITNDMSLFRAGGANPGKKPDTVLY